MGFTSEVSLSRVIALLSLLACTQGVLISQSLPQRPAITGISHMSVFAADPTASKRFYVGELGFSEGPSPVSGDTAYYASPKQYVTVAKLPAEHTTSRLDAIYYATSDAEQLRKYLAAKSVKVPAHVTKDAAGNLSFQLVDPDGNRVGFEQFSSIHRIDFKNNPTSARMIHVGFAVHDRAAEDHFYRDILGFRPYWHGGMKDGVDEWVSLQVPDGSDWLEYMLNAADSSQRSLGVLNHFSLGVVDINDAAKKLEEHGWHETPGEHRQDGRDGKRQLNVFDPDMTRVEFMEFQNFKEPCCSAFTAANPKP